LRGSWLLLLPIFCDFRVEKVTLVTDEGPPYPPKRLAESQRVSSSASLGKTTAQP